MWQNALCKIKNNTDPKCTDVHPWRTLSRCDHFMKPQYDKRIGREVRLVSFLALSLLHRISVRGKLVVDEVWGEWNCIYVVRDESFSPLFKQREISANEEEACTLARLFNLTEFLIKLLFVLHPSHTFLHLTQSTSRRHTRLPKNNSALHSFLIWQLQPI